MSWARLQVFEVKAGWLMKTTRFLKFRFRFSPGLMATQSPRSPGYEVGIIQVENIEIDNSSMIPALAANLEIWQRNM